jgi:shikimate kinase
MNNIANHIFIIGMMGSGKSSIAPLLSSQINIPYIDTDRDLIEIMDAEIQDIFQTLTKQKFYDLESTYFLEHVKGKQHIYATGGGIILKQPNRTMLQNNGVTIFLETSINILYSRIISDHNSNRPLLFNKLNKDTLKEILIERKQHYIDCADIIINTDNKQLNTIVQEIIQSI